MPLESMRQDAPPPTEPECLTARARVRRIAGDGWMDLAILPAPRCSGCEGACMWGWKPPSSLRVRGSGRHRTGDLVSVSLRYRQVFHATLLVHGLPWAGLLAGTVAGVMSLGGDPGALLGAVAGLGLGLLAGRRLQGRWQVRPEVIRVDAP